MKKILTLSLVLLLLFSGDKFAEGCHEKDFNTFIGSAITV